MLMEEGNLGLRHFLKGGERGEKRWIKRYGFKNVIEVSLRKTVSMEEGYLRLGHFLPEVGVGKEQGIVYIIEISLHTAMLMEEGYLRLGHFLRAGGGKRG